MQKVKSLIRVSPPTAWPISLDEVKLFLKIDHEEEDSLLELLISAASEKFEIITGIALISQIWKVIVSDIDLLDITLPIQPAMSVQKIFAQDMFGQNKEIPKKSYVFDANDGSVYLKEMCFPRTLEITYQAGYGESAKAVPASIKAMLLRHIATMYEERSSSAPFDIANYQDFIKARL